tara:strand:+ start:1527 stop:2012 length:486 start_codon:yes stop_codon:yes gene_type:complete
MIKAVLLLGSNVGDKKKQLKNAVEKISEKHHVVKTSRYYQSPSWGYSSKNEFLNLGVLIECNCKAEMLLSHLLNIEKNLGRNRSNVSIYQDRNIDIDIILFGQQEIYNENLVVPHPRMHKRKFCLIPLNEIVPNYLVPGVNMTICELLNSCEDKSNVICLS